MRWTDEVRIETPEQVGVDLELAGLGSRFVAKVIDTLIKVAFYAVLFLIAMVVLGLLRAVPDVEKATPMLAAVLLTVYFLVNLGYGTFFELKRNGQTPGKKFAGIRVVRDGGGPVDFRAAAVRNLLAFVDELPFAFLLGAVLVLVTSRRQRLGDLAAGTVVIRERVVGLGSDPLEELTEHATDEFRFTPAQLAGLAPNDRSVLRELLARFEQMDKAGRRRLALRMAGAYAKKTGFPLAVDDLDGFTAVEFLASLLRDVEEARRHG
jgi:uncharacterized RDD family membrane protein YckC